MRLKLLAKRSSVKENNMNSIETYIIITEKHET